MYSQMSTFIVLTKSVNSYKIKMKVSALKFFHVLIFSSIFISLSSSTTDEKVLLGLKKSQKAFEVVLWYEELKIFPPPSEPKYEQHYSLVELYIKHILEIEDDSRKIITFPVWMEDMKHAFHSDYHKCYDLIRNSKEPPTVDEGEVLNDAATGSDYLFKAFSQCLIHTLRERHGDKAVEDVKNERTVNFKDYRLTFLERQNEFRKLHGVEPLEINEELNEKAQAWANKLAQDCEIKSSQPAARQFKGRIMGESLAFGGDPFFKNHPEPVDGNPLDTATHALFKCNLWYNQIKDYPFPEGYSKIPFDDWDTFHKFEFASQMLWKDTKFTGFGYAYNSSCPNTQFYLVVRYFPVGNVPYLFTENVFPAKD